MDVYPYYPSSVEPRWRPSSVRRWRCSRTTAPRNRWLRCWPTGHQSCGHPWAGIVNLQPANFSHLRFVGISGGSGDEVLLVLLLSGLLRASVQEQIDHNVPGGSSGDGVAEVENLTAEQPPHQTDGLSSLVVAGDSNVDVGQGRVGVAEGDGGDVHVRRLSDGLDEVSR